MKWLALVVALFAYSANADEWVAVEVHCVDTEGAGLNIIAEGEGDDIDKHLWRWSTHERWTEEYFFKIDYWTYGMLETEEGLPHMWEVFQVDLSSMDFTFRRMEESKLLPERTGSCSSITAETPNWGSWE